MILSRTGGSMRVSRNMLTGDPLGIGLGGLLSFARGIFRPSRVKAKRVLLKSKFQMTGRLPTRGMMATGISETIPEIIIPTGPFPRGGLPGVGEALGRRGAGPAGGMLGRQLGGLLGLVGRRGLGGRRRMRPTNIKALRRALTRISGFERIARRVLRITRPGSRVRMRIPKRRRRAA